MVTSLSQSGKSMLRSPQLTSPPGVSPQIAASPVSSKLQSLAEKGGYDPSKLSNVQSDLRSAIDQVRQGGIEDPAGFIKSTLTSSFQTNGIDPNQFRADMPAKFKSSGYGRSYAPKSQGPGANLAENQAKLLG